MRNQRGNAPVSCHRSLVALVILLTTFTVREGTISSSASRDIDRHTLEPPRTRDYRKTVDMPSPVGNEHSRGTRRPVEADRDISDNDGGLQAQIRQENAEAAVRIELQEERQRLRLQAQQKEEDARAEAEAIADAGVPKRRANGLYGKSVAGESVMNDIPDTPTSLRECTGQCNRPECMLICTDAKPVSRVSRIQEPAGRSLNSLNQLERQPPVASTSVGGGNESETQSTAKSSQGDNGVTVSYGRDSRQEYTDAVIAEEKAKEAALQAQRDYANAPSDRASSVKGNSMASSPASTAYPPVSQLGMGSTTSEILPTPSELANNTARWEQQPATQSTKSTTSSGMTSVESELEREMARLAEIDAQLALKKEQDKIRLEETQELEELDLESPRPESSVSQVSSRGHGKSVSSAQHTNPDQAHPVVDTRATSNSRAPTEVSIHSPEVERAASGVETPSPSSPVLANPTAPFRAPPDLGSYHESRLPEDIEGTVPLQSSNDGVAVHQNEDWSHIKIPGQEKVIPNSSPPTYVSKAPSRRVAQEAVTETDREKIETVSIQAPPSDIADNELPEYTNRAPRDQIALDAGEGVMDTKEDLDQMWQRRPDGYGGGGDHASEGREPIDRSDEPNPRETSPKSQNRKGKGKEETRSTPGDEPSKSSFERGPITPPVPTRSRAPSLQASTSSVSRMHKESPPDDNLDPGVSMRHVAPPSDVERLGRENMKKLQQERRSEYRPDQHALPEDRPDDPSGLPGEETPTWSFDNIDAPSEAVTAASRTDAKALQPESEDGQSLQSADSTPSIGKTKVKARAADSPRDFLDRFDREHPSLPGIAGAGISVTAAPPPTDDVMVFNTAKLPPGPQNSLGITPLSDLAASVNKVSQPGFSTPSDHRSTKGDAPNKPASTLPTQELCSEIGGRNIPRSQVQANIDMLNLRLDGFGRWRFKSGKLADLHDIHPTTDVRAHAAGHWTDEGGIRCTSTPEVTNNRGDREDGWGVFRDRYGQERSPESRSSEDTKKSSSRRARHGSDAMEARSPLQTKSSITGNKAAPVDQTSKADDRRAVADSSFDEAPAGRRIKADVRMRNVAGKNETTPERRPDRKTGKKEAASDLEKEQDREIVDGGPRLCSYKDRLKISRYQVPDIVKELKIRKDGFGVWRHKTGAAADLYDLDYMTGKLVQANASWKNDAGEEVWKTPDDETADGFRADGWGLLRAKDGARSTQSADASHLSSSKNAATNEEKVGIKKKERAKERDIHAQPAHIKDSQSQPSRSQKTRVEEESASDGANEPEEKVPRQGRAKANGAGVRKLDGTTSVEHTRRGHKQAHDLTANDPDSPTHTRERRKVDPTKSADNRANHQVKRAQDERRHVSSKPNGEGLPASEVAKFLKETGNDRKESRAKEKEAPITPQDPIIVAGQIIDKTALAPKELDRVLGQRSGERVEASHRHTRKPDGKDSSHRDRDTSRQSDAQAKPTRTPNADPSGPTLDGDSPSPRGPYDTERDRIAAMDRLQEKVKADTHALRAGYPNAELLKGKGRRKHDARKKAIPEDSEDPYARIRPRRGGEADLEMPAGPNYGKGTVPMRNTGMSAKGDADRRLDEEDSFNGEPTDVSDDLTPKRRAKPTDKLYQAREKGKRIIGAGESGLGLGSRALDEARRRGLVDKKSGEELADGIEKGKKLFTEVNGKGSKEKHDYLAQEKLRMNNRGGSAGASGVDEDGPHAAGRGQERLNRAKDRGRQAVGGSKKALDRLDKGLGYLPPVPNVVAARVGVRAAKELADRADERLNPEGHQKSDRGKDRTRAPGPDPIPKGKGGQIVDAERPLGRSDGTKTRQRLNGTGSPFDRVDDGDLGQGQLLWNKNRRLGGDSGNLDASKQAEYDTLQETYDKNMKLAKRQAAKEKLAKGQKTRLNEADIGDVRYPPAPRSAIKARNKAAPARTESRSRPTTSTTNPVGQSRSLSHTSSTSGQLKNMFVYIRNAKFYSTLLVFQAVLTALVARQFSTVIISSAGVGGTSSSSTASTGLARRAPGDLPADMEYTNKWIKSSFISQLDPSYAFLLLNIWIGFSVLLIGYLYNAIIDATENPRSEEEKKQRGSFAHRTKMACKGLWRAVKKFPVGFVRALALDRHPSFRHLRLRWGKWTILRIAIFIGHLTLSTVTLRATIALNSLVGGAAQPTPSGPDIQLLSTMIKDGAAGSTPGGAMLLLLFVMGAFVVTVTWAWHSLLYPRKVGPQKGLFMGILTLSAFSGRGGRQVGPKTYKAVVVVIMFIITAAFTLCIAWFERIMRFAAGTGFINDDNLGLVLPLALFGLFIIPMAWVFIKLEDFILAPLWRSYRGRKEKKKVARV